MARRSPEENSHHSMVQRCTNPKNDHYHRYGGRGIKVCDRWLSFKNFYEDMGPRPAGMTLDRYPDQNGNYEKDNCRWATQAEQHSNRRDNVIISFRGESKTLSEWSRKLGINLHTLHRRIFRGGWEIEDAFTTPPASGREQLYRTIQAQERKRQNGA